MFDICFDAGRGHLLSMVLFSTDFCSCFLRDTYFHIRLDIFTSNVRGAPFKVGDAAMLIWYADYGLGVCVRVLRFGYLL